MLIGKGANVNVVNENGSSALSFAADGGSTSNVFDCSIVFIFLAKY